MRRGRFRTVGASILLAALLIGVSAGAVTWAAERAIVGSERAVRRNDVRDSLRVAHDLLARRQQTVQREASRLAASPAVRRAYVERDAATLERIAKARRDAAFLLWDGRTVGRATVPGLTAAVAVYGGSAFLGRVMLAAEPTAALLRQVREHSLHMNLLFTVAGRIVAASPPPRRTRGTAVLAHGISADLLLNSDTRRPARLYAFRSNASFPQQWLWPWLLGLVASAIALDLFARRETRSRTEPPSSAVRQAVALVGETLAATHNPDALLPVILRAAVEATNAAGGTITSGSTTLSAGGTLALEAPLKLELVLEVAEGEPPATMTLFAPAAGFTTEARDAAAWISTQAGIALENARLHGLVQRQAVTDELTGLANRRRFLSQLDIELSRSRRSGSPLAIVLADLDDFKLVNDKWGHAVGDEALRGFASILRTSVRDTDLPVRVGGEEFAVLLPDTDLVGGAELAERVRLALAESDLEIPEARIRLTASFGVSCFPIAAAADELLADADRKLYEAKRRGKNTVVTSNAGASSQARFASPDQRPAIM